MRLVDTKDLNASKKINFRQFISFVFVLFSLYLLGDAFSRWDGFSYYASFSEFIPSVALAFILWSIVAAITAAALWLVFKLIEWFGDHAGLHIRLDHLLLSACLFALLGGLIWKAKRMLLPDVQTTKYIKLTVLASAALLSVCLSWVFRYKAGGFMKVLQERITPLVWLFGVVLLLSLPLVSYHAWIKDSGSRTPEEAVPGSLSNGKRPNIILVTYDAFAAREMSLYGYRRETTRFIDEWAKSATVFTNAKSASNFTTPAVASLMTGKRVWTHQTYHIAGSRPVRSSTESLPAVLKGHGYFTMAFVVNPFASPNVLGMSDSFDLSPLPSEFGASQTLFGWKFGIVDKLIYRAFGGKIRQYNWILKNEFIFSKVLNLISRNISQTPVPPETAFNRFFDAISGDIPNPFFAWIHIFPPHDPYLPPEPFKGRYSLSRELSTYKKQEKLIEEYYRYLFRYLPYPEELAPSVSLMRDYYDEFIAYIDRTFKDFIAELNRRNTGNTVIIMSADHGESFDHGYFTHGGPFLYEQVTHVPLIIKEPGQTNGRTSDMLVEQIDIPATVLDLADVPVPTWMEGRSLVPLMKNERLPGRPAFSMNFEGNRSRGHQILNGSIAVWEGGYKLIHYLERNESLLFNLKRDPDELDNLIDREKETAGRLLDIIKIELNKANRTIKSNK